jgi:hypothetical protein
MPAAAATTANLRYGRMNKPEKEKAEIPIKKTAHVVLTVGSTTPPALRLRAGQVLSARHLS